MLSALIARAINGRDEGAPGSKFAHDEPPTLVLDFERVRSWLEGLPQDERTKKLLAALEEIPPDRRSARRTPARVRRVD